jgi:hypothetical protein
MLCFIYIVPKIFQVTEDFTPVVSRIKASMSQLRAPKGEISYSREQEAVWFKGKRFIPNIWTGTPGEEQIKHLKHALDSKGRKVGEEWFTTTKVEAALSRCVSLKNKTGVLCFLFKFHQTLVLSYFNHICKTICHRYHEANVKANTRVLELLRGLAAELQSHINIIVFSATLLVITKALYAHVRFVNILCCFCFIFVDGI